MKKSRIILGGVVLALATAGMAACARDNTPDDPIKYTVAFENTWGGVFADQTVENGGNAVKPQTDPVRTGWTFDGWYLGDVEYTFTEAVTSDITLVAKYTSVLGGSGTKADPFTVDNAEELRLLAGYIKDGATEFADAAYVQTADIVSTLTSAIPSFNGVYDGRGYTLTVAAPMFAELSGTVQNLTVTGNVMSTEASAGIVADTADGATLSRVTVGGSIANADGIAGGLVGIQIGGRIEYSTSTASVSGSTAGGIVGESAGVVINGLSSATVAADRIGGGAVGVLKAGGLLQNVGFDGSVKSDEIAGGAVGIKHADSAAYRAFVYGDAKVQGETVGGLIGKDTHTLGQHADVADCFVTDGVTLPEGISPVYGEERVGNLDGLVLPQAVWNTDGDAPELKAQTENAPATVELNVNGNATDITYGSHVDRELFTVKGMRFSTLIEADTDVTLKTAMRMHNLFAGSGFVDADAELSFKVTGADIKADGAAQASTLTHVVTYGYVDTFEYTPDFSNPDHTYDIDYDAPVSIYTDGEKYYAFVLQKQQIQSGYVAFLESFEQTQNGWEHTNSWYPKADVPRGAFSFTTAFSIGTSMTHFVIIDNEYKVKNGEGYYLTRYLPRYVSTLDDTYTDGDYVVGRGFTLLFLGDKEDNAYTKAFAFEVNYEGYVDFLYVKNGEWVNSTGSQLSDATSEFLGGTWFDGEAKYSFDTETSTVTVNRSGDAQTAPYTIENGVVKFAFADEYSLMLAPTTFGAYKLVSTTDDRELTIATYISGAFDGQWLTANGDVIVISSEPAASVTFNGKPAQANEALYNGVQAVRFLTDDKEYHLVNYREDDVTLLIDDSARTFAFNVEMLKREFAGSYVSVADGVRYELTVADDLTVSVKHGGGAVQTGKAIPQKTDDGALVLTATVGGVEYDIERKDDVLAVEYDGNALAFASSDMFALFVGEYTNGKEKLAITENGTFARYARDGAAGEYTKLTAEYRAERVAYGGENRGFVLSYTVDEKLYFFYADAEARNIRLFNSFVNSAGNLTTTQINNFVEEKELAPLFGSYERTYDGKPDVITFAENGTVTRKEGDKVPIELGWYPLLNYNYNTKTSRIVAYTNDGEGMSFTTLVDPTPTGITWGMNAYVEQTLFPVLSRYFDPLFLNGSTSLTVGATNIGLAYLNEKDGDYVTTVSRFNYNKLTRDGETLTFEMGESGLGVVDPKTATAVLRKNGEAYSVTVTIGDGQATVFESVERLDYNSLIGEYVNDGTTYSFTVESSWFGDTVKLEYKEGSSTKSYYYSTSDGVTIMSDGSQAIKLTTRTTYAIKYIWKVGNDLMICDSLDASKAIAAENSTLAKMLSLDELQMALDGKTFTASDKTTVSFELGSGLGKYFDVIVGDAEGISFTEEYEKEVGIYTLYFEGYDGETCCVKVYLNEINSVTKILVGETAETATKEYLPGFVMPTVDELKALLKDTGYKAADGSTAMFWEETGIFGNTYKFMVDNVEYFSYIGGTYENGVYSYQFEITYGASVTVDVTYTVNGVEKITVSGKDYLPVQMPTVDELIMMLDGKKFVDEYNSMNFIEFELTSHSFLGEQLNLSITDGETVSEIYYDKKCTVNDKEYIMSFSESFDSVTVTVTLDPLGQVKTITIGETEYIPEQA